MSIKPIAILIILLLSVALPATSLASNNPLAVIVSDEENIEHTIDLETRKLLLNNVLNESDLEISSLKERLNNLQLPDENWDKIRNYFIASLLQSHEYYESIKSEINDEMSLEEIQSIAKELKNWRETVYSSQLKEMANLILIFEEENLINTANSRLNKISEDLKKFEKQKFSKAGTLKNYFAQAQKRIENAQTLNNSAKELFFKALWDQSDDKKEIEEEAVENTAVIENPQKELQDIIRDLIKDSIKEIKTSYEIFFSMNNTIKKILQ